MWRPGNAQWWVLVVVALFVVAAWPPAGDKSLALKLVNWAVDPSNELPILPEELGLGVGDDPDAVAAYDMETQLYYEYYNKGGWSRRRLELKVATDPFNPATERQVLTMFGVAAALVVWRFGGRTAK